MSEQAYPYKETDGNCKYSSAEALQDITVTGFTTVASNSVAALQSAIALNPVAVSIDATCLAMRFYSSGVFDDVDCGTDLDHAVLATGYGVEGGQKYYNVKNSWNTGWGEEGYIKIAAVIGKGIVGIQMASTYPNLE